MTTLPKYVILEEYKRLALVLEGTLLYFCQSIRSKLNKIQARQDAALELYVDGKIDDNTWQRKQNEWQYEVDQIQREISSAKRARLLSKDQIQNILDFIQGLKERYCQAKGLEKAQILRVVLSTPGYRWEKTCWALQNWL